MMKISQYDYDPKQDLIKQLTWGGDASNIQDFSKLLDILELRQKVLMKYQTTQHYEQKRYENILRRLQSKILGYFKKAEELWLKTHKGQTKGLEEKISGLENLKNQYRSDSSKLGSGYKEASNELATLIIEGGNFIPTNNKQAFEDTVIDIVAEKIAPGNTDVKDIASKIDFHNLILLTLNEIKRKRLVAAENLKLKSYIEKAEQSGDIKEQIVAFEQALNTVHNSGPLLQYLALDKFNRPIINAHEPFEAFLKYLSNMRDEQLEITEEDMDKIRVAASRNYWHKIAFLGKREIPSQPSSEWIIAKDFNSGWDLTVFPEAQTKAANIDFNKMGYKKFIWVYGSKQGIRISNGLSYQGGQSGLVAVNRDTKTAVWVDGPWAGQLDIQALLRNIEQNPDNAWGINIKDFTL